MKRSTGRLLSVQRTGLLLAAFAAAMFSGVTPAAAAMLPDLSDSQSFSMDVMRPEIVNCPTSRDGTFDVEAYRVFETACRSAALCLGLPAGIGGLPGVRTGSLEIQRVSVCRLEKTCECRLSGSCGNTPALEVPSSGQARSRSEKIRTAARSSHK